MERVTYQQFADHVGIAKSRVPEIVKNGVIDPAQGIDQARLDYCQDQRDRLANKIKDGGSLTDHRTRLEKANADRAELDLAEKRGELIPVELVNDKFGVVASNMKSALLAFRSRSKDPESRGLVKNLLHELQGAVKKGFR